MSKKSAVSASSVFGFVRQLSRDTAGKPGLSIEGLLDADAFERELVKERARVDRGGPPFTLLAIEIRLDPQTEEYAQAAWVLGAVLLERTRIVDTKGWFRRRVGVILPGAKADNITKIWSQIESDFKRRSRVRTTAADEILNIEVFVYPSDGKHSVLHEAGAVPSK